MGKNSAKKLYLHDLTREDIRNYVESQLFEHSSWDVLIFESGQERAVSLVEEITARSRGVFLWVFLVTRLLRDGLTNHDTLLDLQNRLEKIPTDLGNFLKVMLESVDPFYHGKMASTLQIALTAKQSLPVIIYSFHDLEYEDSYYAMKQKVEPWSKEKQDAFQGLFSRRLNSRCKGLLEVQGCKVEFLHRTVRDFFRTAEMRDFLASKAIENFDPSFSIFQAYVAWIKHKTFFGSSNSVPDGGSEPQEHLVPVLDEVLPYAIDGSNCKKLALFDVVDDLEWSVNLMFDTRVYGKNLPEPPSDFRSRLIILFRKRLLRIGLADYIARKLNDDSTYLDSLDVPPLAITLGLDRSLESSVYQDWPIQRLKLLRDLLAKGHDPNQSFHGFPVAVRRPMVRFHSSATERGVEDQRWVLNY